MEDNIRKARGEFLKKMGDVFLNLFVVFAAAAFAEVIFRKSSNIVEIVLGFSLALSMLVLGGFLYRKGGKLWI